MNLKVLSSICCIALVSLTVSCSKSSAPTTPATNNNNNSGGGNGNGNGNGGNGNGGGSGSSSISFKLDGVAYTGTPLQVTLDTLGGTKDIVTGGYFTYHGLDNSLGLSISPYAGVGNYDSDTSGLLVDIAFSQIKSVVDTSYGEFDSHMIINVTKDNGNDFECSFNGILAVIVSDTVNGGLMPVDTVMLTDGKLVTTFKK